MIKILPSLDPVGLSGRGAELSIAGAEFINTKKPELIASCMPGFIVFVMLSDSRCLLKGWMDKFAVYDLNAEAHMQEEIDPVIVNSVFYPNASYLIKENKDKSSTVITDVRSKLSFSVDGCLGYWKYENDSFLFLAKSGVLTCVDIRKKNTLWKIHQKGSFYFVEEKNIVLVVDEYTSYGETALIWLDASTGEKIKSVSIPYNAYAERVSPDKIIMTAARSGKRFILHYDVSSDHIEEVEVDTSFKGNQIIGQHYYQYLEEPDNPYKDGPAGSSIIKRFDIYTGEARGELRLPNVAFIRTPDYFQTESGMGAVSYARVPWPEHHQQLILWDEEDFDNPNPEVYQEPLMGSAERIEDGDQAYYRVFVDAVCDSYFQLHRQLSVKLYQTGASKGFDYINDDKPRDVDFNGKIVCDVTNHTLNQRERLAIKHLCEHVAKNLADDSFASAYDPADPITIVPRFE